MGMWSGRIDLTPDDNEAQIAIRHADGGGGADREGLPGHVTAIWPGPVVVMEVEDSREVAVSWHLAGRI